jgi:hypothetical protein
MFLYCTTIKKSRTITKCGLAVKFLVVAVAYFNLSRHLKLNCSGGLIRREERDWKKKEKVRR